MWICLTAEALRNFGSFKNAFRATKLSCLNPYRVMYSGNSLSAKKLNLLCDRDNEHYNVITNLIGAMAMRSICNGCDTLHDCRRKGDKVFSMCIATPLCTKSQTKHCSICNRRFLSDKSFQNHLTLKVKGRLVSHWRQVCRNCSYSVTAEFKHECFKKFCNIFNK